MHSMTIKNILSRLCVTGIYPFNRSKLTGLGKSDPTSESLELPSFQPNDQSCMLKEIDDFHLQYCGHNTDDMNEQYIQWKQMYHPYSGTSVSKGTDRFTS